MNEGTLEKVVAKIASTHRITPGAALDEYKKRVEDTKFHIRIFNQELSDEEIILRAETTVENQILPPPEDSGGSGKRLQIMRASLAYMLQARAEGRTVVHPKLVARFLFDSGIRQTKSNKPDAKSVGDALGIEGLRLVKLPDHTYPIPTKSQHFISNKMRDIDPPPAEECSLEALCRKYEVDSPLLGQQKLEQ